MYGIEPGEYRVECFNSRYVGVGTITLEDGVYQYEASQIQLRDFPQGASAKVSVDGEELSNVAVELEDENGAIVGYGYSDENGVVCFTVKESGKYIIRIIDDRLENVEMEVLVSENVMESVEIAASSRQKEDDEVIFASNLSFDFANDKRIGTDDGVSNLLFWDDYKLKSARDDAWNEVNAYPSLSACCSCDKEDVDKYLSSLSDIRKTLSKLDDTIEKLDESSTNIILAAGDLISDIVSIIPVVKILKTICKVYDTIQLVNSLIDLVSFYNEHFGEGVSIIQIASDEINTIWDEFYNEYVNPMITLAGAAFDRLKVMAKSVSNALRAKDIKRLKEVVSTLESEIKEITNRINQIEPFRKKAEGQAVRASGKLQNQLRLQQQIYQNEINKLRKNAQANKFLIESKIKDIERLRRGEKISHSIARNIGEIIETWGGYITVFVAIPLDIVELLNNIDLHSKLIDRGNETLKRAQDKLADVTEPILCQCDDCDCEDKVCKCKTGGECHCENCKCTSEPPEPPNSTDPNEILGPIGADFIWHNEGTDDEPYMVIDGANWINSAQHEYTIYFENKSTATASAQEIYVSMKLPNEFDANTLAVDRLNIGGEIFSFATDGTTLWLDVLSETGQKIIAYDIASGSSKEIYSNTDMNKDIPFQLAYSGGKLIGTYVHVETQTTYLATIDPESGESKLLYEIGEGGVYEALPDKLTVQHFITEVDEEGRFYGFPEYEITQIDPQTGASKLIYTGTTYEYTGEYYDDENPTDSLIGYVKNYPDGVAIMEGYADNESYDSFLTIHTDNYTISPDEANFQYFAGDKSCAIFGCHRNSETPLTLYTYDIEKHQRIIMDISGLPAQSTPVGRNFVLHNADVNLKGWFYVIPVLGMAVRLEPTPAMIVNTATGGGMTAISCYTFDQKNSDTIYLFNK